jgi:ABC-type xylose transport system permease subunit
MTTILTRYLDVFLVLATAPVVIAAGLPLAGYLIATCAWLLTRVGAAAAYTHALRSNDPRVRAGLQVGTMMARVWLIALAVILARYAVSKEDGVMAAAVVLCAFTVYFVMTLVTRGGSLQPGSPSGPAGSGPSAPGMPSAPQGRPGLS